MKTKITALALLLIINSAAWAQDRVHHRITPEERADRVTAHLTEQLQLNEEQAARVRSLQLAHMEETRSRIESTTEREERKKIRQEQHQAMKEELKTILSEEQMQKFEKLTDKRKQKRGEKKERHQHHKSRQR